VELVRKANAPVISDIGQLLLGIVDFIHPKELDNRALWAAFGVAFVINLVLVWRLPPVCPPAGAGGTIAPAIALYSVTFVVNGVDQIVDDSNNSLRVYKNAQMTVKEVTICVAPFEGPGGMFYVEFQPYNTEDQLIDPVRGSPLLDAESGFTSIPGPDCTWVISDDWQKISILSTHFPPGGTQNPYCQERACEFDDRLEVHPTFDGLSVSTPTPSPTSTVTVTNLTEARVRFAITLSNGDELKVPAGGTLTLTPGEGVLVETIITVGQSSFPRDLTYQYLAPGGSIPEELVGPRTSYVAPDQPGPDFITVLITDPETGDEILHSINVVVKKKSP